MISALQARRKRATESAHAAASGIFRLPDWAKWPTFHDTIRTSSPVGSSAPDENCRTRPNSGSAHKSGISGIQAAFDQRITAHTSKPPFNTTSGKYNTPSTAIHQAFDGSTKTERQLNSSMLPARSINPRAASPMKPFCPCFRLIPTTRSYPVFSKSTSAGSRTAYRPDGQNGRCRRGCR